MIDRETLEAIGQMMAEQSKQMADMMDTKLAEALAPINGRLDKMDARMSSMDARMSSIEDDMRTLKADNAEIREDLQSVKADTARLVTMEKTLGLLMEAQGETREKVKRLDKVAEDVEEIKIRVSALEGVTKENTSQIKDIHIAK